MPFDPAILLPILPEITLLILACTVLLVDLYLDETRRALVHWLAIGGLVLALVLVRLGAGEAPQVLFGSGFVRDDLTDLLRSAILVVGLLALTYARPWLADRGLLVGEYYVLGLFALLGMLIMVGANSFLTLYLGLELQALCLYALVAFDRDCGRGAEAAVKYFVLGSIGSGMLLYGISMIYGATGSIELGPVAAAVSEHGLADRVLVFGLVFLLIGIAFKFGGVPFHMWLPDVYQGAPTPVALLIGSAPKIAALGLALRMLVDGLGQLQPNWQDMLVILAVLSLGLGNVVAVAQSNFKRMLAYSTISHVGFIFLGLLAGSPSGLAAATFYAIVYALMATGAFGILIVLSRKGFDAAELADLKGLADRDPWYAAMMAVVLFSMAGVPPTVGFMAKLLVLDAVIREGMLWLALVAIVFAVIGAFYYLRAIKSIYVDPAADDAPPLVTSTGMRMVLTVNGLALLVLGLFPNWLLALCRDVFI